MSRTRNTIHIVFGTKNRRPSLQSEGIRVLFKYIYGIIQNQKCRLIRLNGMPDHLHLLIELHPSVSLANFVKEVKQSSSRWLRNHPLFPIFDGWGESYYAESVSREALDACVNYIKTQQSHHVGIGFSDELKLMAQKWSMEWSEDDLK